MSQSGSHPVRGEPDYLRTLRGVIGPDLLLAPAAAALIWNGRGEALVTENGASRRTGIPEGAIRPDESPRAALVRVAKEEIGLEVTPLTIAGIVGGAAGFRPFDASGGKVEYTLIIFHCRIVSASAGIGMGGFQWLSPRELCELHPGYPPELFRASGGAAVFQWDESWLETLLAQEE